MTMAAAGIASAAAGDMAGVVADCHRAKQLLQEAAKVLYGTKDRTEHAKGKVASATQIVTGGTGRGQSLQVQCGQSTVKLEEMLKTIVGLIARAEEGASHASHVEGEIRTWAASLVR